MTIAVLALQGAFIEHQQMLHRLGVESVQIRNLKDWEDYLENCGSFPVDNDDNRRFGGALIIPGGESTSMMRIMKDEGLMEPLRDAINNGMPVFGTCAGLIMLDDEHLGTMNIHAKRNAYGRQLGSFHHEGEIVLNEKTRVPMTFIRAPYIESVGEGVKVLSVVEGKTVAAQQGKQFVTAFHPELDDSQNIHRYFVENVI